MVALERARVRHAATNNIVTFLLSTSHSRHETDEALPSKFTLTTLFVQGQSAEPAVLGAVLQQEGLPCHVVFVHAQDSAPEEDRGHEKNRHESPVLLTEASNTDSSAQLATNMT